MGISIKAKPDSLEFKKKQNQNKQKKPHKQTHWKLCCNKECMLHVCVSVTKPPILKHLFNCLSRVLSPCQLYQSFPQLPQMSDIT